MVNIHKFYVLPTHCIYVFCVDLRTNSGHFPIQHKLLHPYDHDAAFSSVTQRLIQSHLVEITVNNTGDVRKRNNEGRSRNHC